MLAKTGKFLKMVPLIPQENITLWCLSIWLRILQTNASNPKMSENSQSHYHTETDASDFIIFNCSQFLEREAYVSNLCCRPKELSLYTMPKMANFADETFLHSVNTKHQTIMFYGVVAHHSIFASSKTAKLFTQGALTLLLHGIRMWPPRNDAMLWPFVTKTMAQQKKTVFK